MYAFYLYRFPDMYKITLTLSNTFDRFSLSDQTKCICSIFKSTSLISEILSTRK